MRTILLAAALSFSGLAVSSLAMAQTSDTDATTGTEVSPADTGSDTSSDAATSSQGDTSGTGVTQQGTVPTGVAMPPPGTNQPVAVPPGAVVVPTNQAAPFTPKPAATAYPPCSKTVTDACTQTYERGVRRARSRG
jgi:hypothetical protein